MVHSISSKQHNMSRVGLGLIALLTATILAAFCERSAAAAPAAASRPNIVFLLIDDMGWPDVACYGHPFHETPTIDALARQGMKFTDFYAATPVCSSTRCTIQAGQNAARVGITDFIPGHMRPFEKLVVPPIENALPTHLRTPADQLGEAGYGTGYFGKWHLGHGPEHRPEAFGYQETARTLGKAFRQWRKDQDPGPKRMDLLTDQAIYFIEEHQDEPFFLTVSHHAVHIPIEAREATVAKYETKPKPEREVINAGYAAMIEDLDRSVARILDTLARLDLQQETVVIFTSDNGGLRQIYTGVGDIVSTNAPLRDEKGTLYEGGIRVPMIVRWPGVIQPGTVCDEPATTIDLLPTFCEIAEAPLPPNQTLDGNSLTPLLNDPQARLDREAIYFHYPHYHHSRPAGAIRMGEWKLIEFFDGSPRELYNLAEDLGETHNVAEEHPQVARRLAAKLAEWREEVGARMPQPNPNYDPERADLWWNRRSDKPIDVEAMRRRYESRTGD